MCVQSYMHVQYLTPVHKTSTPQSSDILTTNKRGRYGILDSLFHSYNVPLFLIKAAPGCALLVGALPAIQREQNQRQTEDPERRCTELRATRGLDDPLRENPSSNHEPHPKLTSFAIPFRTVSFRSTDPRFGEAAKLWPSSSLLLVSRAVTTPLDFAQHVTCRSTCRQSYESCRPRTRVKF